MRWKHRNASPSDRPQGGVYMFGYFARDPSVEVPTPDDLLYEVIYIGDAKNLNKRPRSGVHHKISRYHRLFGDDSLERLHLSLCPFYETACTDYAIQRTA